VFNFPNIRCLIALAIIGQLPVFAQSQEEEISRLSPLLTPGTPFQAPGKKDPVISPGQTAPAYSLLYEMSVSTDPAMRMRALEAWGDSDAPEALMQVINGLLDADDRVRDVAAKVLSNFGAKEVFDFVLGILNQGDAYSLGQLNNALPALKTQLEDRFLDVFKDEGQELSYRSAAAYALGRMGSQAASELLAQGAWSGFPDFAYTCTEALYNIRDANSLGAWRGLLGHENGAIRRYAVYGVCTNGSMEALGILRDICLNTIPLDPPLQVEAARAINAWPAQNAIPVLIEAMQANRNVAPTAAQQLMERTGMDFGETPELWISWWMEVTSPPQAPQEDGAPPVNTEGSETTVIPSTVGTP